MTRKIILFSFLLALCMSLSACCIFGHNKYEESMREAGKMAMKEMKEKESLQLNVENQQPSNALEK